MRVVADEEDEIVAAVNELRPATRYVFTTGGIGPTHDDITADCIAKAFGVAIDVIREVAALHARQLRRGAAWRRRPPACAWPASPTAPSSSSNTISVAPGFMLGNVIVMAGIPVVMQAMLDAVTPELKTGRKMLSVTIEMLKPEGEIAKPLEQSQLAFADVSMGSYPFVRDGRLYGTELVLRSTDAQRLEAAEADLRARLAAAGLLG